MSKDTKDRRPVCKNVEKKKDKNLNLDSVQKISIRYQI